MEITTQEEQVPLTATKQTQASLESLRQDAESMPAISGNGGVTIRKCLPVITDLRKKGYSWTAIQKFFADRGLEYHVVSLANAYRVAAKEQQ